MTIKEAKEIIISKLIEEVNKLPEEERVPVEAPRSITGYKLNHPKGAFLVVYKGGSFAKTKNGAGVIMQDRDIEIGVVAVVRKTEYNKQPEEYIEFVHDALAGFEVEYSGRAENKIFSVSDEWIDEEEGIWRYAASFAVPAVFIEKSFRNV
ncbi:MAG TPA: Gp37 family protein [Ignavibacteriales bacterium]|nr:Gp37 family protein [Ignavibacteriales bacterium]